MEKKIWEKASGGKVPMQTESLNPSKIFNESDKNIFVTKGLSYSDKFREKIAPLMNIEISGESEFLYDLFWDKQKKEEVKGIFVEVVNVLEFNQFWLLFYYLMPRTWYNSGDNGILADLFDTSPYTYIRVKLPSSENIVIKMCPYTRGDFSDDWIGIKLDCVDEKSLTWSDFFRAKIFSLSS